jgi:hypothetical protein
MTSLSDPRGREVDELAWKAEQCRRAGDFSGARRHFADAATIEQEIAESSSKESPRITSVLAVSAVALWYKATHWANAERLAHRWLAEERMVREAREELTDLLQRCWVESQFEDSALEKVLPIELRLIGGDVMRGLAPARLVKSKQSALIETLERIAEWKLGYEYREKGRSKLGTQLEILQAPARAASYGVRLYLRSTIGQGETELSTESLLREFFRLAADSDHELAKIEDRRYRDRFVSSFQQLCADGKQVADIVYSSPTWRVQLPEVHLDREVRSRLAGGMENPVQRLAAHDSISGVLNMIKSTKDERFIEIRGHDGEQTRIHLSHAHDVADIASMLEKSVVVTATVSGRNRELVSIELREELSETAD